MTSEVLIAMNLVQL